jgi:hypothetical protein
MEDITKRDVYVVPTNTLQVTISYTADGSCQWEKHGESGWTGTWEDGTIERLTEAGHFWQEERHDQPRHVRFDGDPLFAQLYEAIIQQQIEKGE